MADQEAAFLYGKTAFRPISLSAPLELPTWKFPRTYVYRSLTVGR
jgi:hypothetical protein